MSEYYEPKFIFGPKDGALVPMPLWVLDEITLVQKVQGGKSVVYYYELDKETKDYVYKGQEEESTND